MAALALSPLNNALLGLARSYGAEFALRLPGTPVLAGAVLPPPCWRAVGALVGHAQHTFLTGVKRRSKAPYSTFFP